MGNANKKNKKRSPWNATWQSPLNSGLPACSHTPHTVQQQHVTHQKSTTESSIIGEVKLLRRRARTAELVFFSPLNYNIQARSGCLDPNADCRQNFTPASNTTQHQPLELKRFPISKGAANNIRLQEHTPVTGSGRWLTDSSKSATGAPQLHHNIISLQFGLGGSLYRRTVKPNMLGSPTRSTCLVTAAAATAHPPERSSPFFFFTRGREGEWDCGVVDESRGELRFYYRCEKFSVSTGLIECQTNYGRASLLYVYLWGPSRTRISGKS